MIRKGPNNVVYVDSPQDEVEAIRQVAEKRQFATVKTSGKKKGVLVDLWSASMFMNVYDNLSEENRQKLAAMPLDRKIGVCYHIIERMWK